jgi:hypothetical protein
VETLMKWHAIETALQWKAVRDPSPWPKTLSSMAREIPTHPKPSPLRRRVCEKEKGATAP